MPSGVAGGDGVYGRSMNVSLTWLKRLRCRRLALIHIGVVVLVAGALVSFLAGEYGHICLRQDGGNAAMWKVGGCHNRPLPFYVGYADSRSIVVADCCSSTVYTLAPNRVVRIGSYRLMKGAEDNDGRGMTLLVAHDPVGMALVYLSYILLVSGMLPMVLPIIRMRNPCPSPVLLLLLAGSVGFICWRWCMLGCFPAICGGDTLVLTAVALLFAGIVDRRMSKASLAGGLAALAAAVAVGFRDVLPPVLVTPLLFVHVVLITVAYACFAILAVGGIVCFFRPASCYYPVRMLRVGVFCLAAGIMVGSVWAAMAWGRYWSWDPKECMALLTMVVYLLPLHIRIKRIGQRWLCVYWVVAFAVVLVTWFGLNSGLHSY